MNAGPLLFTIAWLACVPSWAQPISLTDKTSQKTITATVVSLQDGMLTIRTANHKTFSLAYERLDAASQARAQDSLKQNSSSQDERSAAQLNMALGPALFHPSQALFEEPAEAVASRLNWPLESKTAYSSSYRYYPPPAYRFAKARPYSVVLYGDLMGKTSRLSLVFANKGDYNSTVGMGADHFHSQDSSEQRPETLRDAIKQDYKKIEAALTRALGEGISQRFGETGQRRPVARWDWKGHAFLLEEERDEYVSLSIMTSSAADQDGQTERIADTHLRERLLQNIVSTDHGDVYLSNIPMVDQGPKGYCAPATFERAMRYMAVPADMYLLATTATAPGGGTNTDLLASEAKRQIRRKARRITDISLKRELRNMRVVRRYIDRGVPILWCMRSVAIYNTLADEHTQRRSKVTDWTGWAASLKGIAQQHAEGLAKAEGYHICLIIGYNETTDELAVSDSWGPSYALRWVPREVCQAVTYAGGFVINL